MIFVDSNIPMYLVGAPHANKPRAQALVERALHARQKLVTSAEVLQEILHRYAAMNRRDAIQPAYDVLLGLVDEVYSVTLPCAQRAKEIVLGHPRLSARDALHLAVMEKHAVKQLLSFDTGFDAYPLVTRLAD